MHLSVRGIRIPSELAHVVAMAPLLSFASMHLSKATDAADVYVLTLTHSPDGKGNFENRFNRTFTEDFHAALDFLEAETSGPAALVVTSQGKFFSNGLDLDFMMNPANAKEAPSIPAGLHGLLGRLIVFGVPTVAAINGHAFAGGFMLAQSCDYRVCNSERGFLCMNEAELGMPLSTAMNALLRDKLPGNTMRDTMLHARRWTASDALKAGIVDSTAPPNDLLKRGIAIAAQHAPRGANRKVYSQLKTMMWLDAALALTKGGTVDGMMAQAKDLAATLAQTSGHAMSKL